MGDHKKNPAKAIFCENDTPYLLTGDVSQAAQESFCDNEYHNFLQLMQFIPSLNYVEHVENVNDMPSGQATLLRGSILETILHHLGYIKYPRKIVLIWNMEASYGLKLFRSYFIDFMKCGIPVNNVTKISRIIFIVTTIHKFINSNGK